MPAEGNILKFTDAKTLHDKPVSIYIDFETSHIGLSQVFAVLSTTFLFFFSSIFPQLCADCMTLYKNSYGSRRAQIMKDCRESQHVLLPGGKRCEGCLLGFRLSIEDATREGVCPKSHDRPEFRNEFGEMVSFPICTTCLEAMSQNSAVNPPCIHSKTTPEAALELISYSIIVVENFGPLQSESGESLSYPR